MSGGAKVAAFLGCAALATTCGGAPASRPREKPASGHRVLFIGNSLTAANDLLAMLRAFASAAGESLETESVVGSGYSLDDHLTDGMAAAAIARGGFTVVALQQGPSSEEESRIALRRATAVFAARIRGGGARPALYMVWPEKQRLSAFDRVSQSYALAAADVDGLLFPAGEAWRAAWRRDAAAPLYGPDAFHPSSAGTYAAALTIFAVLYGRSPVGLPAQLSLPGGTVSIAPALAATLQEAAADAIAKFARK